MEGRLSKIATGAIVCAILFGTAARAEDQPTQERSPIRFVGTIGGGAGIPVLFGRGNVGGFVTGTLGARFGDFVQWDVADIAWFGSLQSEPGFPQYNAYSTFLGTAARFGYFGENWPVHPYLSAGLGAGAVRYRVPFVIDVRDWGFAGNVGVGLEVPLGRHVAAAVRYRWFAVHDDFSGVRANLHAIGAELSFQ